MTQTYHGLIDANSTSGSVLADDLNDTRETVLTSHSGATQPSYAMVGTVWLNTTDGEMHILTGSGDQLLIDFLQAPKLETEYHDPTGAASYRIVGNTLECWGSITTTASGTVSVTFPKVFATNPMVNITPFSAAAAVRSAHVYSLSTTAASFVAFNESGTQAAMNARWEARGEWDGVS